MPLIIKIFLGLVLAGTCQASVTFDGGQNPIPRDQWRLLETTPLPAVTDLARDIDAYPWESVEDKINVLGRKGHNPPQQARLDIRVTYEGSQRPLLLLLYTSAPEVTVGVLAGGEVLLWKALDGDSFPEVSGYSRMVEMVELPIDKPGDYQLILQGSAVLDMIAIRSIKLTLNRNYVLRDYPAWVSSISGALGAQFTFAMFCLAMAIIRFRWDLFFALCFLIGSLLTIYLHEGVLFLTAGRYLDAPWWIIHCMFMAINTAHFGLLLFVSEDLKPTGWTALRKALRLCGWVILIVGIISIFLSFREHVWLRLFSLLIMVIGFALALVALVVRGWRSSWRDRLFALFVGSYFAVTLYRFYAGLLVGGISTSAFLQYLTVNLIGLYLFVEHLLSITRDVVQAKTRETADLTRVDLVNRFSHELRTPLNAIIGLADLMKNSKDPEKIDSYANMIQNAGHTLIDLVNDILDFSKLDDKRIPLAEKPVRLDELVAEVMISFIQQAMTTGIVPVTDIDPDVPFFLLGDDLRIKQIFTNLINNAVKFSPPGKPVIFEVKKGRETDDRVELVCSVRDEGRGIPDDKTDVIFEPYTQAAAEDGGHLRGTGLGLAICKLLVEQMNGSIRVKSKLGVGTTFHFNLWLKRNPDAPDLAHCFAPLQGKQLLIVSTYLSLTGMMVRFLRHWGAEVTVAATRGQAPSKIYDLILVDSIYKQEEGDIAWINRQPETTVIEILLFKPKPWRASLTHPNVHHIIVPTPILVVIARFVEHMTGQKIDIFNSEDKPDIQQFNTHDILLVDDNKVNLTVAGKLLESIGAHTETAINGAEALEQLQSGKTFSLVLLDCEMPDISGFEVCRRWRTHEKRRGLPRTPIVALTAHALSEVRDECYAVGMDDVLYKPIGRKILVELLSRYPGAQAT